VMCSPMVPLIRFGGRVSYGRLCCGRFIFLQSGAEPAKLAERPSGKWGHEITLAIRAGDGAADGA
jgi:hypothetical protein